MKQIPVEDFDDDISTIIIRKLKTTLPLGAAFQAFKKLEILRIVESNVPAIGLHTFWGVPSLRILGEHSAQLRELEVGRQSAISLARK